MTFRVAVAASVLFLAGTAAAEEAGKSSLPPPEPTSEAAACSALVVESSQGVLDSAGGEEAKAAEAWKKLESICVSCKPRLSYVTPRAQGACSALAMVEKDDFGYEPKLRGQKGAGGGTRGAQGGPVCTPDFCYSRRASAYSKRVAAQEACASGKCD